MARTALLVDRTFTAHRPPAPHPERPARIEALLDLGDRPGRDGVLRVAPRAALPEEVRAVHTERHFRSVRDSAGKDLTVFDADTSAGPESYATALLAAGGFLEVCDRVVAGDADNGLALVRPPGHHAESDRVMGFCLFNNVAIAAEHLRRKHGMERVAVLDWDVHHGNGTQEIFYENGDVLYVSLHEHPLYPGTGLAEETGRGAGEGATLNVPLPAGCGDEEYAAAMEDIVVPAIRSFSPEFLLVSAGFDAHRRDPLAGMRVSEDGFVRLTRAVLRVAEECCGGRTACVLEGGYETGALRASVGAVLGALAGEPAPESAS